MIKNLDYMSINDKSGSMSIKDQEDEDSQSTDKATKVDRDTTVEQFRSFFEIYDSVLPYLNFNDLTKTDLEKKRNWIARLEQEDFPVAFLGLFSAGKSTIINAILGREVLPEATEPTTAFPTIIRKGETDRVSVYYIDEDTKNILWNQLCDEIGHKIDKKLNRQSESEEKYTQLEQVKIAISEFEEKTNNKIDTKLLQTLEQLFEGWGKDKYKTEKSIELIELQQYIEGHEDALFIDRIEVHLENISIPNDIVMVDLPGLAVANQRHVQYTKQYIQEKAKAFVVCMKPKHLLEGEEIKFLEETNRSNPTILQRSFWAINHWDTLDDHHRQEEQDHFDQKIRQYNFPISSERFFKFSALNYLLLTCIANETIEQTVKLKSHKSNLKMVADPSSISSKEAKDLLNHEEIKSFSDFYNTLFDYLNNVAKKEFIKNAKIELKQAIENLRKFLEPFYNDYIQSTDIEKETQAVEVHKQLYTFNESLKDKVKQFKDEIKKFSNSNIWKPEDTKGIEKQIRDKIVQLKQENFKDRLQSGIDVEGLLTLLPSEVEKSIDLTLLLREKLVSVIEDFFIKNQDTLLFNLKEVNKDYLPEGVLKTLEDKLGKRDIAMRLNGLADRLFYEYGNEFDRIGLSLGQSQDKEWEERISTALDKYESGLINFVTNLVDELNKYVARSVINHAKYLEKELLELFNAQKERIIFQIAQKVSVSEVVASEKQKQIIVKNTYATLVSLINEL